MLHDKRLQIRKLCGQESDETLPDGDTSWTHVALPSDFRARVLKMGYDLGVIAQWH